MKTTSYCGPSANTAQPILRVAPILIILLFTLFPAQAIKRIEANPINIAYMLAQDTDSASIVHTLTYYGYQPVDDGNSSLKTEDSRLKTTYIHRNGSTIRYSFKDTSIDQPYPYVEVKSKLSSKDIDSILIDLGFKKDGGSYIRKLSQYARNIFTCKHGPQGFLIFHQTRIPRQE